MSRRRLAVAYRCTYLDRRALTCVKRILNAGCGGGFLVRYIDESGAGLSYVGIDLSQDCLVEAQTRFPRRPFVQAELQQLPFKANAFDVAYCRDVVIHHPAPYDAIAELYRVASSVLLRIRTAEVPCLFTSRYREREILHHFFPLHEVLSFLKGLVPAPELVRYAVHRWHPRVYDRAVFETPGAFTSYFVTDLFIAKGGREAREPGSVRVVNDTVSSALHALLLRLTARRPNVCNDLARLNR